MGSRGASSWAAGLGALALGAVLLGAGEAAAGGDSPALPDPLVYRLQGEPLGSMGYAIAVPGDVDGDGVTDFATTWRIDGVGSHAGLFSGKDGHLLRTWRPGDFPHGINTLVLHALMDLDADGIRELGISTVIRTQQWASQELFVLSPLKAEPFYSVQTPGYSSTLPEAALVLGDIDGDGQEDYVLGQAGAALPEDLNRVNVGWVSLRSGASGAALWTRWGPYRPAFLGASLAPCGDLNGDGASEVLTMLNGPDEELKSSFSDERPARVLVLDGRTGETLREVLPPRREMFKFGIQMAALGDRDGDGYPEVAIAAPKYRHAQPRDVGLEDPLDDEYTGRSLGWVGIYQLPDFDLLHERYGKDPEVFLTSYRGDEFGDSLSRAGDVDGDGIEDLLVGTVRLQAANGSRTHSYLLSGADGRTLTVFDSYRSQDVHRGGPFLSPLGDVNGDGRPEFIVATGEEAGFPEGAEFGGIAGTGIVRVLQYVPGRASFLRADLNEDGVVNLSDGVVLGRLLADPAFQEGNEWLQACPIIADVNGDERLDAGDFFALVNHLFGYSTYHTFRPAPPFPDCGQYVDLLAAFDRKQRDGCSRSAEACAR